MSKICVVRSSEGRGRKNEARQIFEEIITDIFLKPAKDIKSEMQNVLKLILKPKGIA